MFRAKQDRGELVQRYSEVAKSCEKAKEEVVQLRVKAKQYKEKLRLANSAIKSLSGKVVQYESDRNAHGGMNEEVIRVGGINIEGAERESNNSGRGSEAEIKAI